MKDKKIFILVPVIILTLCFSFNSISINSIKIEKNEYKKQATLERVDEIRKTENIVFLGDSITDWYPIEEIFGNLPIVNSGVAGYETDDILKRMETMVYQYNPTKVFILIGTNDLKYEDDDEKDVANKIEEIIKNIKKNRKKAEIYVQSIYPVNTELKYNAAEERHNDEIKEVNSIIEKYCKKNDVDYIDMYSELEDDNGYLDTIYTDDGLHPNDLGYARITKKLLEYIY